MGILRPGIAGFDSQSEVDFAVFKKTIYAAALDVRASVLSTAAANITTPSFHQCMCNSIAASSVLFVIAGFQFLPLRNGPYATSMYWCFLKFPIFAMCGQAWC